MDDEHAALARTRTQAIDVGQIMSLRLRMLAAEDDRKRDQQLCASSLVRAQIRASQNEKSIAGPTVISTTYAESSASVDGSSTITPTEPVLRLYFASSIGPSRSRRALPSITMRRKPIDDRPKSPARSGSSVF